MCRHTATARVAQDVPVRKNKLESPTEPDAWGKKTMEFIVESLGAECRVSIARNTEHLQGRASLFFSFFCNAPFKSR